jgi:hypothetical protein
MPALVVALAVVTGLDLRAVVMLVRARLGRSGSSHSEAVDDWLGDAILVARRERRWFGPFRSLVMLVIAWCDRIVIARLRQHPILGAALASLAFGTGVGLNQAIREGYLLTSSLLAVGLLSCGMFAFLMLAGSYLGVVRSGAQLAGVRRRLIDATVIACLAALVALPSGTRCGGLSERTRIPPETASSPGFLASRWQPRSRLGSRSSPSCGLTPGAMREPDPMGARGQAPPGRDVVVDGCPGLTAWRET